MHAPKTATAQKEILRAFRTIPGVGKSIAQDLWDLGFRSLHELKNKNPEKMYSDFEKLNGQHVDRCLLYVFRCAVYFVSNTRHENKKLLWWNWKDRS